jgi:sulfite oxidase
MSTRRKVKGVGWGAAALGTAAWGGARLSDVLTLAGVPHCTGVTTLGGRHVEFVSCDVCKEEEGGPYKASIPLLHATTPEADILLAYEMNGKDLNRDHGFPLRVVVPGVIGARSVKWLETIIVSEFECQVVQYFSGPAIALFWGIKESHMF